MGGMIAVQVLGATSADLMFWITEMALPHEDEDATVAFEDNYSLSCQRCLHGTQWIELDGIYGLKLRY